MVILSPDATRVFQPDPGLRKTAVLSDGFFLRISRHCPNFPVRIDKRQVFHVGIGQCYAIHAGTQLCTSAELIQDLCHPLKSIILSYVFHPNSYACRRESINRQQLILSGLIRNFCFNQFLYISHGFLGSFPHGYADKLFESSHEDVEANQLKGKSDAGCSSWSGCFKNIIRPVGAGHPLKHICWLG
jgi:hypothetical protein